MGTRPLHPFENLLFTIAGRKHQIRNNEIQMNIYKIRRGKKKKDRNYRAKIRCPHLLCRADIEDAVSLLRHVGNFIPRPLSILSTVAILSCRSLFLSLIALLASDVMFA